MSLVLWVPAVGMFHTLYGMYKGTLKCSFSNSSRNGHWDPHHVTLHFSPSPAYPCIDFVPRKKPTTLKYREYLREGISTVVP